MALAASTGMEDATAATLATADRTTGRPSARFVLIKELDARGFVFYTNLESRKARELDANPQAALCFYWTSTNDQVRAEGRIERVTDAEADTYFATRPRGSQIGAWASPQSRPLASHDELDGSVREVEARFAGQAIPRPAFWGGYRLLPDRIEFWKRGEFRLHDRTLYVREGEGWRIVHLYP